MSKVQLEEVNVGTEWLNHAGFSLSVLQLTAAGRNELMVSLNL